MLKVQSLAHKLVTSVGRELGHSRRHSAKHDARDHELSWFRKRGGSPGTVPVRVIGSGGQSSMGIG